MEKGGEEMRRDREHGRLPGEEDSAVGGSCWSRERFVGDGERNQGRNCSAQELWFEGRLLHFHR